MDTYYEGLINQNNGLLFICFTATWCVPCQRIKDTRDYWKQLCSEFPNITFIVSDIDEKDDLYSFYRKKRLLNGIPAIVVFEKHNKGPIFTDIINSSNIDDINQFFTKWLRYHNQPSSQFNSTNQQSH
jgi:thiol-disulfide isomerase/thioredoxin